MSDIIRVLDIDVDIFVDPRIDECSVVQGCRAEGATAWSPEKVRGFLRDSMSMSSGRRMEGQVFDTHELLLDVLVAMGEPVCLYHLDSHADLGLGLGLDLYRFLHEFLGIERERRLNRLADFQPNECDFLLYAIACGFVHSMVYVTHPDIYQYNNPDIPIGMDRWKQKYTDGALELRCFKGTHIDYAMKRDMSTPDCSIPLCMHNRDDLRLPGLPYDYMFITRSPEYTPTASDDIVNMLRDTYLK